MLLISSRIGRHFATGQHGDPLCFSIIGGDASMVGRRVAILGCYVKSALTERSL